MKSIKSPTSEELAELSELLCAERNAFEKAKKAAADNTTSKGRNSLLAQDWFAAVARFSWRYCEIHYGHIFEAPEALVRLSKLAEAISVGKSPDPLKFALVAEGHNRWPQERKDICEALRYIEAVERGSVSDPYPSKTIQEAFDVSGQTVRNWKKERDQICEGVPGMTADTNMADTNNVSPGVIRARMERAGRRYKACRTGRPAAEK